jgi:hypothetical protein
MNSPTVSVGFSVISVFKFLRILANCFNREDAEKTNHEKSGPVMSSRELEKGRKLGDRELFRACVWR